MYTFIDLINKCIMKFERNKNKIEGIINFYKAYIFASTLLEMHGVKVNDSDRIEDINFDWKLICFDAFADTTQDLFRMGSMINIKFNKSIQKDYRVINQFLNKFKGYAEEPEWWTEKGSLNIKAYSDTFGTEIRRKKNEQEI